MLFPERMFEVEISIPYERVYESLRAIGDAGVLHVNREGTDRLFHDLYSRTEKLLSTVEGFIRFLKIETDDSVDIPVDDDAAETLSRIESEIAKMAPAINRTANELKTNEKNTALLENAARFSEAMKTDIDTQSVAEKISAIGFKAIVLPSEHLETFMISLKGYAPFIVYEKLSEGSMAIALFYEISTQQHMETAISELEAFEIPRIYFTSEKRDEIRRKKEELQRMRHKLSATYGPDLRKAFALLSHLREIFNVQSALKDTGSGYLLSGWVPKKKSRILRNHLKNMEADFSAADNNAPVLLRTPLLLRSFESMIKSFSHPMYNEINPTVPFAVAFIVMFGAMFGDVGHGLVLMAAGYIAGKKFPLYRDMGNIYIMAGGGSVVFGFFYGSIFGFHDIIPHLLYSPVAEVELGIYTGIIIGVLFITFSFALNIFSLAKRRDISSLLWGEGGILWFLIYWLAIGITIKTVILKMPARTEIIILSVFLLLLFTILLVEKRSFAETLLDTMIGIFEHAVNTISFARLGAFALAHGALFLALFSIADIISQTDMHNPWYWLIIVLGNCFIIVLEGVVVTIQTLRLEYYEFFKRFFKGGGTPYKPFRLKDNI